MARAIYVANALRRLRAKASAPRKPPIGISKASSTISNAISRKPPPTNTVNGSRNICRQRPAPPARKSVCAPKASDRNFKGVIDHLERNLEETASDEYREWLAQYMSPTPCAACAQKRLRPESLAVKIGDYSMADLDRKSDV